MWSCIPIICRFYFFIFFFLVGTNLIHFFFFLLKNYFLFTLLLTCLLHWSLHFLGFCLFVCFLLVSGSWPCILFYGSEINCAKTKYCTGDWIYFAIPSLHVISRVFTPCSMSSPHVSWGEDKGLQNMMPEKIAKSDDHVALSFSYIKKLIYHSVSY